MYGLSIYCFLKVPAHIQAHLQQEIQAQRKIQNYEPTNEMKKNFKGKYSDPGDVRKKNFHIFRKCKLKAFRKV